MLCKLKEALFNIGWVYKQFTPLIPEKRKELKINKSTLWYQQKKIKEGKTIKVYSKTKVKIGWVY